MASKKSSLDNDYVWSEGLVLQDKIIADFDHDVQSPKEIVGSSSIELCFQAHIIVLVRFESVLVQTFSLPSPTWRA